MCCADSFYDSPDMSCFYQYTVYLFRRCKARRYCGLDGGSKEGTISLVWALNTCEARSKSEAGMVTLGHTNFLGFSVKMANG